MGVWRSEPWRQYMFEEANKVWKELPEDGEERRKRAVTAVLRLDLLHLYGPGAPASVPHLIVEFFLHAKDFVLKKLNITVTDFMEVALRPENIFGYKDLGTSMEVFLAMNRLHLEFAWMCFHCHETCRKQLSNTCTHCGANCCVYPNLRHASRYPNFDMAALILWWVHLGARIDQPCLRKYNREFWDVGASWFLHFAMSQETLKLSVYYIHSVNKWEMCKVLQMVVTQRRVKVLDFFVRRTNFLHVAKSGCSPGGFMDLLGGALSAKCSLWLYILPHMTQCLWDCRLDRPRPYDLAITTLQAWVRHSSKFPWLASCRPQWGQTVEALQECAQNMRELDVRTRARFKANVASGLQAMWDYIPAPDVMVNNFLLDLLWYVRDALNACFLQKIVCAATWPRGGYFFVQDLRIAMEEAARWQSRRGWVAAVVVQ